MQIAVFALQALLAGAAPFAQATVHGDAQHDGHATPPSVQSGPSSLSDTQIQQLLAGDGMGQASAAERNGFPGPKHVLELADALKLTPDQRSTITAAFERMRSDTRELGKQIVQAERELFARFESKSITESEVDALVMRIGHLQATLRARHLKAHLETIAILTAGQITEYGRLRGHVGH